MSLSVSRAMTWELIGGALHPGYKHLMFLRAFLYTPLRSLLSCSSALFVCKACSFICFLLPPSSSRWLYITTLSHPVLAVCKNVWGTHCELVSILMLCSSF